MGRLDGRVALVAGGAGNVGEGIVRGLLRQGARVVVPSRGAEKGEQLRGLLGGLAARLVTLVGNVTDAESAARLRDEVLSREGRLDAVAVAVGGWWQGPPLVEVPMEAWDQILRNNLLSHVVVARTLLPVLTRQGHGVYTMIGGNAAGDPVPGSSLACVAAAAQLMMARMLMAESKGSGVRINEVVIGTPVITRGRAEGRPEWLTADEVGDFVAWLSSDDARMVNGVIDLPERPPLRDTR